MLVFVFVEAISGPLMDVNVLECQADPYSAYLRVIGEGMGFGNLVERFGLDSWIVIWTRSRALDLDPT